MNRFSYSLRPITHWWQFKIWHQALASIISAEGVTDSCYQRLHLYASNTHIAVQHALFRIWQSLETQWQIVKMASSSESSDEGGVLLLVLMLHHWSAKNRLVKEEEWFGVELALKYCPS